MKKKTILIDLDGVLNEYIGNYDPDYIPPMKSGADNFLQSLYNNYELKIFTTRDKILATEWLKENNLDKYISDITNIKVPAWLIIDDRCLTFNGNYQEILSNIQCFKPWYRQN